MFILSNGYVTFSRYCNDGDRARVRLGFKGMNNQSGLDREALKKSEQLLLNRIEDKVIKHEESCARLQEPIKKIDLENLVKELTGKSVTKAGFIEDWRNMMEKMRTGEIVQEKNGRRYAPSSIQSYDSALKMLIEFSTDEKVSLNYKFDMSTRNAFVQWAIKNKYSKNSISLWVALLRTFLKYTRKIGKHNNFAYKEEGFYYSDELTDAVALSLEEIKAIYSLKLTGRRDEAKDAAAVGCFLGLRKGDLCEINNYVIRDNVIEILTGKTDEKVIIPLHPIIKEIHDKYNGNLPIFKGTQLNYHLPVLGKLAAKTCKTLEERHLITMTIGGVKEGTYYEKWELISPHTLRRSFATNTYKAGIPIQDIMKITGHRSEEAFLRYIRITKEENAQRLSSHPFFTTPL